MANNYKRWLCEESLKTPSSRPILIYFEFRSKLSFEWTLTRPTNFNLLRQNIVLSYSERIPVSFSWLLFFFFFCYFTFINFLQKSFYYYYFIIFFFLKIIFIFSCSGVFRDVPECSGFYRRPFIIYILRNTHQKAMSEIFVRRLVLANQRSERWFSHVKKMIRPIRIANDVFSRVRKMIRPVRSHRGVWVSRQNSRLLLQLAAPLRTHSTRKVYSKSISR